MRQKHRHGFSAVVTEAITTEVTTEAAVETEGIDRITPAAVDITPATVVPVTEDTIAADTAEEEVIPVTAGGPVPIPIITEAGAVIPIITAGILIIMEGDHMEGIKVVPEGVIREGTGTVTAITEVDMAIRVMDLPPQATEVIITAEAGNLEVLTGVVVVPTGVAVLIQAMIEVITVPPAIRITDPYIKNKF